MSRRTFRLATILRIRKAQEQEAAGRLARANAQLSRAEARVAATSNAHSAHVLNPGDGQAFLASVAARAALNVAAQDALVEQQLASQDVESATSAWRDTRRATKSLEHLEARHDRELREAEFKSEQKLLDDLAGRGPAAESTTPHPSESDEGGHR